MSFLLSLLVWRSSLFVYGLNIYKTNLNNMTVLFCLKITSKKMFNRTEKGQTDDPTIRSGMSQVYTLQYNYNIWWTSELNNCRKNCMRPQKPLINTSAKFKKKIFVFPLKLLHFLLDFPTPRDLMSIRTLDYFIIINTENLYILISYIDRKWVSIDLGRFDDGQADKLQRKSKKIV